MYLLLSSLKVIKKKHHFLSSFQRYSSSLPNTADTVVIGGGVVGTSTAYHLAKQSNQKVLLLEKTALTSGSTWHAAGLVTNYNTGINIKRLHWYSVNLYSQLEKETGQSIGFHQCGSIRLATNELRMDEFRHQMSHQGWNSAPQRLMNPKEIKEMSPIIDESKIFGGLYTPYDGHVDPYSLTMALAIAGRQHGVHIAQDTQVIGMSQNGSEWIVETNKGIIRTTNVVNAAGFWAREVGRLTNLDLPLVPVHHQYIVTKTVPDVKNLKREFPVLRHLEGSFYIRQERDGILLGPYESPASMKLCEDWARNIVPPGFGKELFEGDLNRLQPHLEIAMEYFPCFAEAEIKSIIAGPITFSPDVYPLLGPTLQKNMWLAAGFAYGIVHGGGGGKFVADWILNGEAPYDLNELDPLRYGTWGTIDYALEKVREGYGMNNAVPYPHEDRLGGRKHTRKSGIYNDCLKSGAFMGFHFGWEVPLWYSRTSEPLYNPSFYREHFHENVLQEYNTVVKHVGLVDLTSFSKYMITGKDSRRFLDHLVTGFIPKVGRSVVTHALTPSGKVYAELTITALDENSFLVLSGANVEYHDFRHFLEHAANFEVHIDNITNDYGALGIVGPKSQDLLSKVSKNDKDSSTDNWSFLDSKKIWISNVECIAIQISYSGELGWELYMPSEKCKTVYTALMNEGKDLGIGHFGSFAMNMLRIEKGFRSWGHEMNLDVNAIEAGLNSFIKWNKKSKWIGQEALSKIRSQLPSQKLVLLSVENSERKPKDPESNCTVWLSNKVIGHTTSGTYSPFLKKGLAFAYVSTFCSQPGMVLEIELMGEMRASTILAEAPVKIYSKRLST